MPSKSKAQRRAAGMAHAAQKGDIPKSSLKGAAKEMAKMDSDDLRKFAKTKEDDLPEKVDEELNDELEEMKRLAGLDEYVKGDSDWQRRSLDRQWDDVNNAKQEPKKYTSLQVSGHQSIMSNIEEYLKNKGFKILKKEGPHSQRITLNVVPKNKTDLFSYSTELGLELEKKFNNKYIIVQPQ